MWFRDTAYYSLLEEQGAVGQSKMIRSGDFRHAVFTIIADDTFTGTVQFFSSNSETRPDLSLAASGDNEYAASQTIKLIDGSSVEWGTGLVFTGAEDGVSQVEINENANKWLGVKVTAYTAGNVTVKVDLADNQ